MFNTVVSIFYISFQDSPLFVLLAALIVGCTNSLIMACLLFFSDQVSLIHVHTDVTPHAAASRKAATICLLSIHIRWVWHSYISRQI